MKTAKLRAEAINMVKDCFTGKAKSEKDQRFREQLAWNLARQSLHVTGFPAPGAPDNDPFDAINRLDRKAINAMISWIKKYRPSQDDAEAPNLSIKEK